MCFVWISEQTATSALYSINRLDFITEVECLLRGTQRAFISLGGSSPLCAITISQLMRWVSQNTTKLYSGIKESKDRQHVSALLFYKAIIRSDI